MLTSQLGIITARKLSCGKVIFSQASVSHSIHRRVSGSVHAGIHPTPRQTPSPLEAPPPEAHTPLGSTPPRKAHTPKHIPPRKHTLLQRTVYILLECFLVYVSCQTSFPVIHKVGNTGILVLLEFESKGRKISYFHYFNFNSKYHDKCKFASKLILLLAVSNLFPLEVIQKMPMFPTLCMTGKPKS